MQIIYQPIQLIVIVLVALSACGESENVTASIAGNWECSDGNLTYGMELHGPAGAKIYLQSEAASNVQSILYPMIIPKSGQLRLNPDIVAEHFAKADKSPNSFSIKIEQRWNTQVIQHQVQLRPNALSAIEAFTPDPILPLRISAVSSSGAISPEIGGTAFLRPDGLYQVHGIKTCAGTPVKLKKSLHPTRDGNDVDGNIVLDFTSSAGELTPVKTYLILRWVIVLLFV